MRFLTSFAHWIITGLTMTMIMPPIHLIMVTATIAIKDHIKGTTIEKQISEMGVRMKCSST